ncbi:MAG TPA: hypothetical protein VF898_11015 [Chloroflexota bacterium]
MRWVRLIGGVLLTLVGLLWILQGTNVIGGSGMSGHGQYTVLGGIVALIGIWLLQGAIRELVQSQPS